MKDILGVLLLIVGIYLVYICVTKSNNFFLKKDNFKPAGLNSKENKFLNNCQVPTLNSDQCFWTQYQECPRYNGSYMQCTNNYIPKPNQNNCKCNNRTFEMCPKPFKISEKCYYNKIQI